MTLSFLKPMALGICLLPAFASAQELQPGLWEISSQNMQVDGQQLPDMQQMLEQLKNLPPEQRQMMEQMLAQQGVQLGDQGIRICISAEQIAAKEFAMPELEAGCTHEIVERSAQQWRFTYSCPGSQGEGLTRFPSDKEFISQIKGTQGGQSSNMESRGRWISADCAGVKAQ